MELVGVFTRREPKKLAKYDIRIYPFSGILNFKDKIDVLIVAFGSSDNLTEYVVDLAEHFNVVDSFDIHRDIAAHRAAVDKASKKAKKLAIVSTGWDPGLMSVTRLYFSAFMPYAAVNSIWGEGVSQGHSEAIRKLDGVKYGVQYTVPLSDGRAAAYRGEKLAPESLHKRVCYVVCDKSDECRIENSIRNMKGYFSDYETEVNFISEKDFLEHHTRLLHNGETVASGKSAGGKIERASLFLNLDSNPDFTAGILLASARAAFELQKRGEYGALTIFDIPPKYFYYGETKGLI